MKIYINCISVILILGFVKIYAQQNFQGEAIYIAQRKQEVKIDSSILSNDIAKNTLYLSLMKKMNEGIKNTYILKFDKESSLYKKEEKLEAPSSDGVRVYADIGFSGDILYKNLKENRYVNENEFYGKIFLIKDKLQKHDWKLENQTKNIGEYTCYKATKIIKRQVRDNSGLSLSLAKNKSKTPEETKTKEIEVIVTAWYTPQIPVSTGPGIYHGLPGLILEINTDTDTILCNKIALSTKNKFPVKEPKRGQVVNSKTFDSIVKKKQEEQKKY